MTLRIHKHTFENAKYRVKYAPNGLEFWRGIDVMIDGEQCHLNIDDKNLHYQQLMELVNSGELTIEPASPFVPKE